MKPPIAKAVIPQRQMNGVEREYSQYLDQQLQAKVIRWWDYESIKLRLADQTWYMPDFLVVDGDGEIEMHEVKTLWSTGKVGFRDDSRVKLKVAADRHPFRFKATWRDRNGLWEVEEFNARED